VHDGQAVGRHGSDYVAPERAGVDACHAGGGIDLNHAVVQRELEQQRAVERGQRLAEVTGRLRRDTQSVRAGVVQRGLHLPDAARDPHRGGALVGGQVPRPAGLVPVGIGGKDRSVGGLCVRR
jgi:hypothetical protein